MKKEKSQAVSTVKVDTPAPVAPVETAPQPADKKAVPDNHISEKDKATLSRFINKAEEPVPELNNKYADDQFISKKSEDYIDENFMNFRKNFFSYHL